MADCCRLPEHVRLHWIDTVNDLFFMKRMLDQSRLIALRTDIQKLKEGTGMVALCDGRTVFILDFKLLRKERECNAILTDIFSSPIVTVGLFDFNI